MWSTICAPLSRRMKRFSSMITTSLPMRNGNFIAEMKPINNNNKIDHHNIRPISTSIASRTYMHDDKLHGDRLFPKPKRWPQYNDVLHAPEDGPVERYYCHYRDNIKYSPKKMYYVASFIRGMSIEEAMKQLTYINLKGATIVREILAEAQQIAIAEHNFEYRSRMWIAESFCSKGLVVKGYRKHARGRYGEIRYFHTHYFVKLVEGAPPKDYLPSQAPQPQLLTTEQRLNEHIEKLRKRRIDFAL